ncbi:ectoine/hydroxyectoine ABC transporter substrate-binding protein EhuB [Burkholderia cepacia]|uniref:ectoine/hydroxyectoine ABC transporter substrate-binding protein EhuB n=1 Tax=Burkholderia cepacia TaxID=292 RepID=UPI002AB5F371|nr:ectoine/hydroxyectoine ABC transporter substrate-binding protein EhuB [Burkholderia cepacia]
MELDRALIKASIRFCAVAAALSASVAPVKAQSITDRVFKDGAITIGIHNVSPWGYVDKDGEAAGLGPDTVRAVLGPLGVKKVNFVIMDWGALIPSLMARRIDAVASGMSITEQRCKQVIFSNPDVVIGDGVLVRAGNPHNIHSYQDIAKNSSLILSGMRGNSTIENALKAGVPKSQILEFPDTRAGIAALLAGRTAADTESFATASSIVKDPNLKGKIEIATPFKGPVLANGLEAANYAAIAFRPDDKKLRDLYNEGQAKLKRDGTLRKILIKDGFEKSPLAPEGTTPKDLFPGCS